MTRSRRVRPTCSREVAAAGGMTRGWRATGPTIPSRDAIVVGRHGCRRTTGVPMSFHSASDRVVRGTGHARSSPAVWWALRTVSSVLTVRW
jgi:hypothetical protein